MVLTYGSREVMKGGIMANLLHIAEGWGKSMGILDVSIDEMAVSVERLKVCAECPNAKESKLLLFLNGNVHNTDALYCTICKCPVNEKSLVNKETCPLGKWDIKQ